ncbi:MAG: aldo/keto reductase [Candidatus Rokuibacteriota bacterium]
MNGEGRDDRGTALSRRAALALIAAVAARAMPTAGWPAAPGAGVADAAPTMLARPIPSTGERLPAVGLGTWRTFDVGAGASAREPLREVLRRFVALGGRVVDSSPMYGAAETVVGDLAAELGLQKSLFVATKVWTRGRDAGVSQMERSLHSLRLGRLDLMQIHNLLDWRTHLRTLRQWKDAGRIRYLGVTHYVASAHDDLERVILGEPLDFVQLNYSLAEREAERRLLPLAGDRGVAVLVNRPYAEGALFRRVRGRPLPPWAADLGCTSWGQLFLKWILGHPAVTCAIPATSKPDHLADNMAAGTGPLPDPTTHTRIAAHLDTL